MQAGYSSAGRTSRSNSRGLDQARSMGMPPTRSRRGAAQVRLLHYVHAAGAAETDDVGETDAGALDLPGPASSRRCWQISQMLAMLVAAIGWPWDSSPPLTFTGVLPSRQVAPELNRSTAPPGSRRAGAGRQPGSRQSLWHLRRLRERRAWLHRSVRRGFGRYQPRAHRLQLLPRTPTEVSCRPGAPMASA
jgi:hypothetical protein